MLRDLVAEEGWLDLDQPYQRINYLYMPDFGSLGLTGTSPLSDTTDMALGDMFGVLIDDSCLGWSAEWSAQYLDVAGYGTDAVEYTDAALPEGSRFSINGGLESWAITREDPDNALYEEVKEALLDEASGERKALRCLCVVSYRGADAGELDLIQQLNLNRTLYYIAFGDATGNFYLGGPVESGSTYTLPDIDALIADGTIEGYTAPAGCTFGGTYTGADDGKTYEPGDVVTVNEPLGFMLDWATLPYTVTLDPTKDDEGNTIEGNETEEVQINYMEKAAANCAVPTNAPEGKRFGGYWYKHTNSDGSVVDVCLFDAEGNPSNVWGRPEDGTVYALWQLDTITYTLDWNIEGRGACAILRVNNPLGQALALRDYNESFNLPSPYRQGYEFLGWYQKDENGELTGEALDVEATILPLVNTTYYAKWKEIRYPVVYDANGGAFANNATEKQVEDKIPCVSLLGEEALNLDAAGERPTRENYELAGWALTLNASKPLPYDSHYYVVADGAEPLTLYAVWQPAAITIHLDPTQGSLPSGTTGSVTGRPGSTATIPETEQPTREGYTLTGWASTPGGDSNSTPGSYEVPEGAATHTIYAQWKANTYTIEFNGNGDDVEGSTASISATYGQPCTLPANGFTRPGYTYLRRVGYPGRWEGHLLCRWGHGAEPERCAGRYCHPLCPVGGPGAFRQPFRQRGQPGRKQPRHHRRPFGGKYTALAGVPDPTRDKYTFTGWYLTETPGEGDIAITSGSAVATPDNHTLYAGRLGV